MGSLKVVMISLISLWSAGALGHSVFYSGLEAHSLLRSKRANSFLEEIKPPSKERECVEEVCDFEEAREIFQNRETTMEFWTVYTDGNQCDSSPCVNGACVDKFQAFSCDCNAGFEGLLCDHRSTATNCSVDNGDCDHVCQESHHGQKRTCSCLHGYSLQANSRSCLPTANFACGQVQTPKIPDIIFPGLRPWMVGGEVSRKGDSPWQVLVLNERGSFHCGGVLIAESWVLTVAHCLKKGTRFSVRLGDYKRFKIEGTEVTVPVAEVVPHPDYDPDTVDNDIALLRLVSPVRYTTYIVPVCLPEQSLAERLLHRNGTMTIVTGWGKEDEETNRFSSALNYIRVPLVEPAQCAHVMHNNVSENMLCAGRLGQRKDACGGDSGGPMVTRHRNTWFLIGLVSWGEGCGHADKLGIYTKVSNYLDWMRGVQSSSRA